MIAAAPRQSAAQPGVQAKIPGLEIEAASKLELELLWKQQGHLGRVLVETWLRAARPWSVYATRGLDWEQAVTRAPRRPRPEDRFPEQAEAPQGADGACIAHNAVLGRRWTIRNTGTELPPYTLVDYCSRALLGFRLRPPLF